MGTYRISDLELKDIDSGSTRRVKHFWYTAWPDHGVPIKDNGDIFPDDVLSFLAGVRTHRKLEDGCEAPAVVHCSAGVGRTGTFIVIEHVMDAINVRAKVDVNELIEEIREDRMCLVQHTCQYKFAYQACINYATTHVISEGEQIYALASGFTSDPQANVANDGTWKRTQSVKMNATLFAFDQSSPALKVDASDMAEIAEGSDKPKSGDESCTDGSMSPSRMAGQTPSLSSQPWFRKKFTRKQVAQTLLDTPPGSFIVRPSSTKKGAFALSVKMAGGRLANYLLIPIQDGDGPPKYQLGRKKDKTFDSVVDLVTDLTKNGKLTLAQNMVQMLGANTEHPGSRVGTEA